MGENFVFSPFHYTNICVIKFVVLYRYSTWSLILREDNIPREFENVVLRKTLMSKGKE